MTKKFINLSRRFSRAATRASFRGKATLLSRLQHLPPAPPQRRPGTELPPPAGVGAGGWGIERGKQAPQSPPPRLSRSPQPGKETPRGSRRRPPRLLPGAQRRPRGVGAQGTRPPLTPRPHAPLGPSASAHLTEPHAWRRSPPPPSHWLQGENGGVWLVLGMPIRRATNRKSRSDFKRPPGTRVLRSARPAFGGALDVTVVRREPPRKTTSPPPA